MSFMYDNVPDFAYFLFARIFSSIYLIFALFGWIGNGLIVIVTIRSKKLHSPCNVFIAMQSFSDMILQLSHVAFFYFAFNEKLVTYYTCWKINFFFVSAADFSTWMVFFIALDRFLSAKHPKCYNNMNRSYYIGVVTFCLAYCSVFKFVTYLSLTDERALCTVGQAVTGLTERIWLGSLTMISCGVVVVYYALTKLLNNASIAEYQRINRSLNTMIVLYLFGWVLGLFGAGVGYVLSANQRVFSTFEIPLAILANINVAAPFFIYYNRSTLYRQEFQRLCFWPNRVRVTASVNNQSTSA